MTMQSESDQSATHPVTPFANCANRCHCPQSESHSRSRIRTIVGEAPFFDRSHRRETMATRSANKAERQDRRR